MRTTQAVHQRQQLVVPTARKPGTLTQVARWTLYISGGLAVLLGGIVWPANVHAVGGIHGLAGWLVIASLWTLAAIAARSGVAHSTVAFAIGWGVVTALGAIAQYESQPGTWITLLHAATGIAAIGVGHQLVMRMRHVRVAARIPEQAASSELAIKDAAAEFLAKKRIAVTGVSRNPAQHGANVVYRRLRERGYNVFAINPNTTEVEGDSCFENLKAVPGGVDAVVIATRPEYAMATMRECADLGVTHVWMHRAVGGNSVSEEAAAWGRQRGMRVIAGGCPLMFDPVADPAHKVMRSLLTLTGKVPRRA